MKYAAVILALFVVVAVVTASPQRGPPKCTAGCVCTSNFSPVCGSNGKTYGNDCALQCDRRCDSRLRMAYKGQCQNGHRG